MKIYVISFARGVAKDLKHIDKQTLIRIISAIKKLAADPRPHGAKKLSGYPYYRIRVGDYRVIYAIDDGRLTVLVVKVGHRKGIYH